MSGLSVRETAARALAEWRCDTIADSDDQAMTDAVLAAVADHDGLVDVLRTHHHDYDSDCDTDFGCSCGAIDDYDESDTDHAAHLADMVRAWLRGTT